MNREQVLTRMLIALAEAIDESVVDRKTTRMIIQRFDDLTQLPSQEAPKVRSKKAESQGLEELCFRCKRELDPDGKCLVCIHVGY